MRKGMARSPESLLISSFGSETVYGFSNFVLAGKFSIVVLCCPLVLCFVLALMSIHCGNCTKFLCCFQLLLLSFCNLFLQLLISPTILDVYIPDAFSAVVSSCISRDADVSESDNQSPNPQNLDGKGLAKPVAFPGNPLPHSVQAAVCWMPGKAAVEAGSLWRSPKKPWDS